VKKYKNFSNHKVVFRCDSADIPEIGSGHLYRSIIIAKFLKKKFFLKSNQIVFVVKTKDNYSKNLTILSKYNFKIIELKSKIKDYSKEEAEYLKNIKANLLIIDRLGKMTKNFYKIIKDSYKKKIIIDDSSSHRKMFDLSLNPLIQNVPSFSGSRIGYKYLILDNFNKKNIKVKKKIKNIFIFFGGFDSKKLSIRVIKILNKLDLRLNIVLPLAYKKQIRENRLKHRIIFFNSGDYLKELVKSNIAIVAGGISLFDAILNKKKIICIPQYKHQKINAKKIAKTNAINYINPDNKEFDSEVKSIFLRIFKNNAYHKKIKTIQKRIIDIKKVNNTLRLISNIYDKSKN
jgi:spore coat polysaccharide biosynthesis predicted glycosyltransferase SpsG|tara:strand:+ start:2985 stop:4022 length:1038 start_codon:yes stop_codon:yes gene_type:complete